MIKDLGHKAAERQNRYLYLNDPCAIPKSGEMMLRKPRV